MTNDEWRAKAHERLRSLAASGRHFTADDLYDQVGHPDDNHGANSRNNLIGSVFREANRVGLIEAVGVEASRQPHRKGGMIRVWRGSKRRQPSLL